MKSTINVIRTAQKNIRKNSNSVKQSNLISKLLNYGLKKEPKPILVFYFTPQTQKEISNNNYSFIKTIQKNVGDKYFILILPAINQEQVRVELWYKGKKQSHFEENLYENNIYAFHDLLKLGMTIEG